MKKLIFFSLILTLIFSACEDDSQSEQEGNNNGENTENTEASLTDSKANSPLIGRWELVEKRIPDLDLGKIEFGDIFYTFSEDGQVSTQHEDDTGIAEEQSSYSHQDNMLSFNDVDYEIVSIVGDSLFLQSETDGIKGLTVLVKQD